MRFLRIVEGKTKRKRIRNEKIGDNMNTLGGNWTSKKIRRYWHVVGMNGERITKTFSNITVKGKHQKGDRNQDGTTG
jgi:hypothetical protein